MHRLALVGGTGVVGGRLRLYVNSHFEVRSYSRKNGFDVGRPDRLIASIRDFNPQIVIYLANSFSINKTEKLSAENRKIALKGPLNFFESCSKLDAKIIFFSSDQVFDGTTGNYAEDSLPIPQNEFGKIKIELEKAVAQQRNKHIIIRTSAVYGAPNARKNSLENWALTTLSRGQHVEGFDNVVFSPTYVEDLSSGLLSLLEMDFEGTVHLSGIEPCSRYNFLFALRHEFAKLNPEIGEIIRSVDHSRKLNVFDTSLNSNAFWKLVNYSPTLLREGIKMSAKEFNK